MFRYQSAANLANYLILLWNELPKCFSTNQLIIKSMLSIYSIYLFYFFDTCYFLLLNNKNTLIFS